jgi:hypothetical protein
MDRLLIGKQLCNVSGIDEFLLLVEEHMGYDAFEWAKRYIKPEEQACNGECDKTYEIQENYEGIIHDAIDELEEIKTKDTKALEKIQKVIKKLYSEI